MAKTTSGKASARTAPPKTPTKVDELIRLLWAKSGGDVATLIAALGWQPHTVRAAITGLRKAGHVVVASRPAGGGALRYRIAPGAGKAGAAKTELPNTGGVASRSTRAAGAAADEAETADAR